MCVKKDLFKRFYIILDVPHRIQYPQIIGVRPDYPLYHQIYEATKSDGYFLGKDQISQMGLPVSSTEPKQFRIYPIEIEKYYFHSTGNPSCKG